MTWILQPEDRPQQGRSGRCIGGSGPDRLERRRMGRSFKSALHLQCVADHRSEPRASGAGPSQRSQGSRAGNRSTESAEALVRSDNADVQVNDRVVTSGLGSRFCPAIRWGRWSGSAEIRASPSPRCMSSRARCSNVRVKCFSCVRIRSPIRLRISTRTRAGAGGDRDGAAKSPGDRHDVRDRAAAHGASNAGVGGKLASGVGGAGACLLVHGDARTDRCRRSAGRPDCFSTS